MKQRIIDESFAIHEAGKVSIQRYAPPKSKIKCIGRKEAILLCFGYIRQRSMIEYPDHIAPIIIDYYDSITHFSIHFQNNSSQSKGRQPFGHASHASKLIIFKNLIANNTNNIDISVELVCQDCNAPFSGADQTEIGVIGLLKNESNMIINEVLTKKFNIFATFDDIAALFQYKYELHFVRFKFTGNWHGPPRKETNGPYSECSLNSYVNKCNKPLYTNFGNVNVGHDKRSTMDCITLTSYDSNMRCRFGINDKVHLCIDENNNLFYYENDDKNDYLRSTLKDDNKRKDVFSDIFGDIDNDIGIGGDKSVKKDESYFVNSCKVLLDWNKYNYYFAMSSVCCDCLNVQGLKYQIDITT